MKLLSVCIKGMSSTVGADLSNTFVLRAVLCAARNKATKKKFFLDSCFLNDQIIHPRSFSTSIEMPESRYNNEPLTGLINRGTQK